MTSNSGMKRWCEFWFNGKSYHGVPPGKCLFRNTKILGAWKTRKLTQGHLIGDHVYNITMFHVAILAFPERLFSNNSTGVHITGEVRESIAIIFLKVQNWQNVF